MSFGSVAVGEFLFGQALKTTFSHRASELLLDILRSTMLTCYHAHVIFDFC